MKRIKNVWRVALATLAAVTFPLILAGCGGGEEPAAEQPAKTDAPAAEAPAADAPAADAPAAE